ncbi:MAG: hypothetical protein U0939_09820 [Pirellulales bacterium]
MHGPLWIQIAAWTFVLGADLSWPSRMDAAAPAVQFDAETLVAAEEVARTAATSEEAHDAGDRAATPDRRRVRVRLRVSVLYPPDSQRDLAELLIRVENPDRTAQVVDYAPRTTLTSPVAGAVRVERHEESSKSLDFEVKGQYPGIVDAHVKGAQQRKATTDSHWENLPPLELCVASGTVNRGHGAYFKFKPTPRTTLEGAHEIELVLNVPKAWRADCLVVKAEAYGRDTSLVGDEEVLRRWTERRFLVLVHAQTDLVARDAALAVLHAESQLRQAVAKDLQQQSRAASPWRDFSAWIQGGGGAEAAQWWESAAYGSAVGRLPPFPERTSTAVREATARYRESRLRLHRLPAGGATAELAARRQSIPTRFAADADEPRGDWERLPPVE